MDIEALEKAELRKKKILVGLLFLSALAVAIVFASWMGAFGLGPSRHIYVRYSFAGGIDKGSPVRLAGIKVGKVSDIIFKPEGDSVISLKIDINAQAFSQITEDSLFYINLAGLIGERYVEVVPGQGTAVKAGAVLRGVDPPRVDQLISQGYGIFGDLRKLLEENKSDIKEIISSLNSLASNINNIFKNATPADRKKVQQIFDNLVTLTNDLKIVSNGLVRASSYIEANGGEKNWDNITELLTRAERTSWNDIRRLLMEDGVKVNFTRSQVGGK